MRNYNYEAIFKIIKEAIVTRNFYLLAQNKIVLPDLNQLKNYLKKNENEFTQDIVRILNHYSNELLEQISRLKEYIDNTEMLDTPEKINEFLRLVPFNGSTSDRNFVVILRLCGIKINYDQDYSKLIGHLIVDNLGGDFNKYLNRIREYGLKHYNSYKVYDEAGIKEYISTLSIGNNGKMLSQDCTYTILLKVIEYIKKNNLLYSPVIIRKIRETIFKDIIDEAITQNGLPIDFQTKTEIKINPTLSSPGTNDSVYKDIIQIAESTEYKDTTIKDLKTVNPYSERQKGSDSYVRDRKVSEHTKNRSQDKDGFFHCELCDYIIKQLEEEISKILENDIEAIKKKYYLIGQLELLKENSKSKRSSYFHSHHIVFLEDGGPDHIYNTICLCPICHSKIHADEIFINEYREIIINILRKNIESKNPEYLDYFNELFGKINLGNDVTRRH